MVPTVYQGSYNAVQRTMEDELLPVLRRHGLCYYAYSASGGGFLAKTPEALRTGGGDGELAGGRWDRTNFIGALYNKLYTDRAATMAALEAWRGVAAAENVSGSEMAYRWAVHHSALDGARGDAVVVGARGAEQLRATLEAVGRGPLSEGAVAQIEEIWEGARSESFLDNFNADEEGTTSISARIAKMSGE